jgi:hypothetical protein
MSRGVFHSPIAQLLLCNTSSFTPFMSILFAAPPMDGSARSENANEMAAADTPDNTEPPLRFRTQISSLRQRTLELVQPDRKIGPEPSTLSSLKAILFESCT